MPTQLPTGTVTFLFTDIEGSTALAQDYPAAMPALLAQHHAILREAIEGQRGSVFRISGDAFCAAFYTAAEAARASLQAQRGLRAADWQPAPLTVRMGLHTGPAETGGPDEVGGDYHGYLTLTRAQRVMAAAHGGQILASGTTAELLRGELAEAMQLRDMGVHRLKGLASPEHLWQVCAPDLPAEFPPLQTLTARPNNLPLALTSFVGRQAELAEAGRLLAQTRLLTLTGPGGTGKTRLAIQTALAALEQPAASDGAWLVELAAVNNGALVLPAAATVLNVHAAPGRPLPDALADFVRPKQLLLILDNCEHLIETCAQVAETLLQAGAGVKVLVSSREPLGIAGETVLRVPSLTLPAPTASLEDLRANEAVQLFVERARAVRPGFALTPQNAAAVIQICRRLDGIPLAIELAAARVALFSPPGIAERLDDRFRLLTGSLRTALPRQQTLESLIDWSYDLLAPEEQALFATLSVFAGSFTYEAAEAVQGGDILATLTQLVNKSLVLREDDPTDAEVGEPCYRLLETIRQYAQAKLLAAGQVATARDRHLAYFARLSKEADTQAGEAAQRYWGQRLERERDNLRAAIEWALGRQPETAMEIIGQQGFFWGQRGYTAEALGWVEAGLERLTEPATEARLGAPQRDHALAWAHWGKAVLLEVQGDMPRAFAALQESVRLWRVVGDQRELARALALEGGWGVVFGIPNRYRASAEEGLALGRALHDDEAVGNALSALGIEKLWAGDYGPAQAYIEESQARMRAAGDARSANIGLVSLGMLALLQGDYATARARYAESLAIFKDLGNAYFANIARGGLAEAARRAGDYPEAVPLVLETLAEWQATGNHGAVARCLECLGFMAGELALAEAQLAPQRDLLERAGRWLGAAEAVRAHSGAPMTPLEREEYDQVLGRLRAGPAAEVWHAGWQRGQAMSVEQAKRLAEGWRGEEPGAGVKS